MRRVIQLVVISVVVVSLDACDHQKGLSAKDLFDLRSKCGAFAEKWAKDMPSGEWGAHYDPKSNRCFLKNDVNGKDLSLYDPQSHTLLASCATLSGSPKPICQANGKSTSTEEAMKYINDSMADEP